MTLGTHEPGGDFAAARGSAIFRTVKGWRRGAARLVALATVLAVISSQSPAGAETRVRANSSAPPIASAPSATISPASALGMNVSSAGIASGAVDARYYNPAVGQFTSPDSVIPNAAGTTGYNLYGYTAGNPVTHVDRSGHDIGLPDIAAAIGVLGSLGEAATLELENVEPEVQAFADEADSAIADEEVAACALEGTCEESAAGASQGPGETVQVNESMSIRAQQYQQKVTGSTPGTSYRVGTVRFDGFQNGTLLEAKGPGYAQFVRNGVFQRWFSGAQQLVTQAKNQLTAAASNGNTPIQWFVAEPDAATAIQTLFRNNGISGIAIKVVAP